MILKRVYVVIYWSLQMTQNFFTNEDCSSLKSDLRLLYKWSVDWQMLFNLDKCKIMHFGYNNPMHTFLLGRQILETVSEEKDLG